MTSTSNRRWYRPAAVELLSPERRVAASPAFTTRRVPLRDRSFDWSGATLVSGAIRPAPGDLVLARVERLGHHRRIELPDGRKRKLAVGEEIIVAYGDRYAPDQFEARIPDDLSPTNLAASGGVAATVLSRHGATRRPTELHPVGLLARPEGIPLNLSEFALPAQPLPSERPPLIAVLGTSMNAGKTTAVASTITGFAAAGYKAGGMKITGTGSGGDYWSMLDSGAHRVLDFTDAGMASTYRVDLEEIIVGMRLLTSHLISSGATIIIMEVADGIYQQETAALLRRSEFHKLVDGVIFAAGDAVGAVGGLRELEEQNLPVIGVTGAFTRSPLAMREVAQRTTVPVLSRNELQSDIIAPFLLDRCQQSVDLNRSDPTVVGNRILVEPAGGEGSDVEAGA